MDQHGVNGKDAKPYRRPRRCRLGFVTEEPTFTSATQKAGVEWSRILFADYGVDNYSIGIIASDELIKANPQLVRKFINATMAGYVIASAEPEAAADMFKAQFPEADRDLVLAQWKLVEKQLVTETGLKQGLGYMTTERMAGTIDMISAYTKFEKTIAPADVFTMEFLEPQRVKK